MVAAMTRTVEVSSSDRHVVERLNGIFVGDLSTHELEIFQRCCAAGFARRSYLGAAGFLGLAKVEALSDEKEVQR
jgi:hypothetical protein